MSVIPCVQDKQLRKRIVEYAEELKREAHKVGSHGLEELDFYNSGLFRGAIERIRGQFSATMTYKRDFVSTILDYMKSQGFVTEWQSAGEANRHDYSVVMPSGKVSIIELKGCLDGNNTTIFNRPPHANEFVVWSICTNAGADPRHNAWSGIHTRLSAEIITRQERVDGAIIWDMICGTAGRTCPKLAGAASDTRSNVGGYVVPPPCIYVFPATIPSPRNNPHPAAQRLSDVEFLDALHICFNGRDEEVNFVDFEVTYEGAELMRTTRISRAGQIVAESGPTAIRRQ